MNRIKTFTTPEDTAKALAKYLKRLINENENFYLAISGGSTPKMLFDALVHIKTDINWKHLHLFWVDERCVPPTHAESNFLMTKSALLDNVVLSTNNIYRVLGELPPEEAIENYQIQIDQVLTENDLPAFDLVILGMGDDGHTASIFPPEKDLITVEKDIAIGTNPYSGQKRVTLTGRTILNAQRIVFHVTGANKATIVDEIIHQKGCYLDYPAHYFNVEKTEWYLDKAALVE